MIVIDQIYRDQLDGLRVKDLFKIFIITWIWVSPAESWTNLMVYSNQLKTSSEKIAYMSFQTQLALVFEIRLTWTHFKIFGLDEKNYHAASYTSTL